MADLSYIPHLLGGDYNDLLDFLLKGFSLSLPVRNFAIDNYYENLEVFVWHWLIDAENMFIHAMWCFVWISPNFLA